MAVTLELNATITCLDDAEMSAETKATIVVNVLRSQMWALEQITDEGITVDPATVDSSVEGEIDIAPTE